MQDEVTVTQADERAVAEFHRQSFETLFATTDADIDAGINRAHTLLCQAFARHRHQAEQRGEVVAWMYTCGQSRVVKENRDPGMTGYVETPLYALPPAPEAGQ